MSDFFIEWRKTFHASNKHLCRYLACKGKNSRIEAVFENLIDIFESEKFEGWRKIESFKPKSKVWTEKLLYKSHGKIGRNSTKVSMATVCSDRASFVWLFYPLVLFYKQVCTFCIFEWCNRQLIECIERLWKASWWNLWFYSKFRILNTVDKTAHERHKRDVWISQIILMKRRFQTVETSNKWQSSFEKVGSNNGIFGIPLFAIFRKGCQIREFSIQKK